MDSVVKARMSAICKELGITTSTALNLFANAFACAKGRPFPVTIQIAEKPLSKKPCCRIRISSRRSLQKTIRGWQNDLDYGRRWYSDPQPYHPDYRRNGGLRERNGLEADLSAALRSFDGKTRCKTTIEKMARVAYGLVSNQVFIGGNKRIGTMLMQLLIKWNGCALVLKTGELADLFFAIADGTAGNGKLPDRIKR